MFASPTQNREHDQIPKQMAAIVMRQMASPDSPPLSIRDGVEIKLQPM